MSPAIGATEFQAAVEINGRLVDTFLLVLAALFPVVNPPGSAFVFLSLTQHASAEVRRSLTRRVSINAYCLAEFHHLCSANSPFTKVAMT